MVCRMNGTNTTALFAPGGGLEVLGQPIPLGSNQVSTTIIAHLPGGGSVTISSGPLDFTVPEGKEHKKLLPTACTKCVFPLCCCTSSADTPQGSTICWNVTLEPSPGRSPVSGWSEQTFKMLRS